MIGAALTINETVYCLSANLFYSINIDKFFTIADN